MVKRKRETKSFLFSLQSHFLSIELWVFRGIIRFHNLHDTKGAAAPNRLRRRKARGRGGGLGSEVAPERRAQGVGEPLLLVPASLPRSFLSASSGSVRQRRASGGREVRRGGQVEVEGLFLGDEGSASVREKEAEALPRRPSRLKIKNSEKELTVTVSATSSAIASSSRCTPSAAEPSLLREARTASTLREKSASAARLRSSAAAPASEAAEAISRSATAETRAGAMDVDGDLVFSSPPPALLLTRAHRRSVDNDSTSVAQSASMEAGVMPALMAGAEKSEEKLLRL